MEWRIAREASSGGIVAVATIRPPPGESMATEPLADAILRLHERGFTHGLRAEGGRIHDVVTGGSFDPETLTVAEVVRFEGESDPDEQAVLFALCSPRGAPLGTYAAVFGPSIPPEDADVIRRLGSKG